MHLKNPEIQFPHFLMKIDLFASFIEIVTFVFMNLKNSIYSGVSGWLRLQELILDYRKPGVYILVGENTEKKCLPLLLKKCKELSEAHIIKIQGGESNKTITGVEKVWQLLAAGGARRGSLLVCLGGGVISDIGGFAASTYKRGMDLINIPTTLLAMVDAALGGKTGINMDSVKNQVGVFAQPKSVFIFTEFLKTLPAQQKLSGYAEMLKHAMIDSEHHFEMLIANPPESVFNEAAILKSAGVKVSVVEQDPSEGGLRKVLNFGHTIGHAIESCSHQKDAVPLLHGEAIAIGLVCETYISVKMLDLDESELIKITKLVSRHFPHYKLKSGSADELLALMSHDKKNSDSSRLNFSLLHKIGEPVYDQFPAESLIRESLHFYLNVHVDLFE